MSLDWRRLLIYTHRWLGIAGCLVFIVWFVSGVVMMYARMPRLTAEERLVRLPAIDLAAVRVPPLDAARAADIAPDRFRVGVLGDRPVYRFLQRGLWTTVFADTGAPLRAVAADDAVALMRRFVPEHASTLRYGAHLTVADQWTLDGGLPRFLPMHRIDLGDADGTSLYLSERTGEAVMKTTRRGRLWGYAGAVLHWTYFTPFRLQAGLWRWSIIYAALIGCVLCLSGLIVGVWRYSPSRRFRLKRERSHSPYAGLMWWHHYAGLLFGVVTFTWVLSGALSLSPWDWAPSTTPTADEVRAVAGGPMRLEAITIDRLRAAAERIGADFTPKELDVLQFQGQPFVMAYRPLSLDHRAALIEAPARGTFTRFPDDAVVAAARAAGPYAPVDEVAWLSDYDAYYYDRRHERPLPVLRVRYADADRTWLYLDPQHGVIAAKNQRLSRLERWLYHGLHSLDFPFLYDRRPLWDIVVIVLSIGGTVLSATTLIAAWRRLRRHAKRLTAA